MMIVIEWRVYIIKEACEDDFVYHCLFILLNQIKLWVMYIEEARAPIWLFGQLFIPLSHYLHTGTQSLTWETLHEFYSESP